MKTADLASTIAGIAAASGAWLAQMGLTWHALIAVGIGVWIAVAEMDRPRSRTAIIGLALFNSTAGLFLAPVIAEELENQHPFLVTGLALCIAYAAHGLFADLRRAFIERIAGRRK